MTDKTAAVPAGRIMLTNVRLSFPELFKPSAFEPGAQEKYKATFLVPQDSPLAKACEARILAVAKDHFKGDAVKAKKFIDTVRGNANKFCWQDGDLKEYDGYQGVMALSAKNTTRPNVMDQNKSPLTAADGKPYAGCYVNASVDFYVYVKPSLGISASLRGVQFFRDGDAFTGGRPADSNEFEEVTEGGDAGDFA